MQPIKVGCPIERCGACRRPLGRPGRGGIPSKCGPEDKPGVEHLLPDARLCEQFSQCDTYTPAIDDACLDCTRIYVSTQHAPPEPISVIVGDIAHNLCSALDHLEWALGNPEAGVLAETN